MTYPVMDMNFIFSCSTRYLTRLLCSLIRYRVDHSKKKFTSMRRHVISSLTSHVKRSPSLWLHSKSYLWKQADLGFTGVYIEVFILSWPLKDKIHIHAQACNILCMYIYIYIFFFEISQLCLSFNDWRKIYQGLTWFCQERASFYLGQPTTQLEITYGDYRIWCFFHHPGWHGNTVARGKPDDCLTQPIGSRRQNCAGVNFLAPCFAPKKSCSSGTC